MKQPYISKYLQNQNKYGYSLEQGTEIKETKKHKKIYSSPLLNQKRYGLNEYFSFNNENYDTSNEVDLVKKLQQEQIRMFGYMATYILRTNNTMDELYGESIGSNFSNSFRIEVMPDSPEGMIGQDAIGGYGYMMTDTVVLHVSFDRLVEEITKLGIEGRKYPLAGDLIAWDMPGNLMEIRYVEDKVIPFAKGTWTMYALHCQVFNLGRETFTTGDDDIDFLNEFNETYEYPNSDNESIHNESQDIIVNEPNTWNLDFNKKFNYN